MANVVIVYAMTLFPKLIAIFCDSLTHTHALSTQTMRVCVCKRYCVTLRREHGTIRLMCMLILVLLLPVWACLVIGECVFCTQNSIQARKKKLCALCMRSEFATNEFDIGADFSAIFYVILIRLFYVLSHLFLRLQFEFRYKNWLKFNELRTNLSKSDESIACTWKIHSLYPITNRV